MKLIIAYIQPDKLNSVKQELYKREIYKISITNALGCGQQMGYTETYRGVDIEVNLLKKLRIEIAVNDSFVSSTTEAIINGAGTNSIGDGKIFIVPIEECIRIRNNDTGAKAIG
jgi:nitrogen regulatory protein P-II 2